MQHENAPYVQVTFVPSPEEEVERDLCKEKRLAELQAMEASFIDYEALPVITSMDDVKTPTCDYFESLSELGKELTDAGVDHSVVLPGYVGASGIESEIFLLLPALAGPAGFLLGKWVEARNGRKLKIKVGDIEVEATQMKEKDVLRIFDLLQEKADRKKTRELLLKSGNNAEVRSLQQSPS